MSDLNAQQQTNVRIALRYLRARCGNWRSVSRAVNLPPSLVCQINNDEGTVTVRTAFRVARVAGVSIDDLLAGKFPPAGTCPHCGRFGKTETSQLD